MPRLRLLLAFLLCWPVLPAWAAWPERPITLIVPWTVNSGSNLTARTLAPLLSRQLGQPVNVVNTTGGGGVTGHKAIAEAAADGYTLGLITVEVGTMHWPGLTPLTYRDFTAIGQVSADPAVVLVAPNSPHKALRPLLDAIKAAPVAKYRVTGTGQGGVWHLAFAWMLQAAGIPAQAVPWTPSQGAFPAIQELGLGVADIVIIPASEARAAIREGKALCLGVMALTRHPLLPNVPTLPEATGFEVPGAAAWRGIAAPKGLAEDIRGRLEAALKVAYDSPEFAAFLNAQGQMPIWRNGAEFEAFMAADDTAFGAQMKRLGLIK